MKNEIEIEIAIDYFYSDLLETSLPNHKARLNRNTSQNVTPHILYRSVGSSVKEKIDRDISKEQ